VRRRNFRDKQYHSLDSGDTNSNIADYNRLRDRTTAAWLKRSTEKLSKLPDYIVRTGSLKSRKIFGENSRLSALFTPDESPKFYSLKLEKSHKSMDLAGRSIAEDLEDSHRLAPRNKAKIQNLQNVSSSQTKSMPTSSQRSNKLGLPYNEKCNDDLPSSWNRPNYVLQTGCFLWPGRAYDRESYIMQRREQANTNCAKSLTEGRSKSGREKDTTELRTSDTESKDCSSEVSKNISDESKKSTEGGKKCRDEGNNCQGEVNKNCSALYSGLSNADIYADENEKETEKEKEGEYRELSEHVYISQPDGSERAEEVDRTCENYYEVLDCVKGVQQNTSSHRLPDLEDLRSDESENELHQATTEKVFPRVQRSKTTDKICPPRRDVNGHRSPLCQQRSTTLKDDPDLSEGSSVIGGLDLLNIYSNIGDLNDAARREFSPVRRYFNGLDREFSLGEAGTEDDLTDSEGEENERRRKYLDLRNRMREKIETLEHKKMELESRIKENEGVGYQLSSQLSLYAGKKDVNLFSTHIQELGSVSCLLLGLAGRLAKAETSIEDATRLDNSDCHKIIYLREKKEHLVQQINEAQWIKSNIDKRSAKVEMCLERYLGAEGIFTYDEFIRRKLDLVVERKETEERLQLGKRELRKIETF